MSLSRKFNETGDSDDDSEDLERLNQDEDPGCWKGFTTLLTAVFYKLGVFLRIHSKEIKKRKVSYCLGVLSCFVVVLITALMLTTLGNLPILFLRLGEIENGEMDLIIEPGGQAIEASSLNYNIVEQEFPSATNYRGLHSPRIILDDLAIFPKSSCLVNATTPASVNADDQHFWFWPPPVSLPPNTDPNSKAICSTTASKKEATIVDDLCVWRYCSLARQTTVTVIDSLRELEISLGKNFLYRKPLGAGECIISKGLAQQIGVGEGDEVVLAGDIASPLLEAFKRSKLSYFDPLSIYSSAAKKDTLYPLMIRSFKIVYVADDSAGKLPNSDETYLFLEYSSILKEVAVGLSPNVPSARRGMFSQVDPKLAASQVVFNFPQADRIVWYGQSDYADIQRDATKYSSPVIARLGFNQLDISMPILQYLFNSRFFALFLGLILSLIIVSLSFLSIVLIYSLLTVGVEMKTFELGVLRMVGMTKVNLLFYVLTNAMMFAIPAWVLGLIVSQLAFLLIRQSLSSALNVDIPPGLTGSAIGFATLAGLGIPLISGIAPSLEVMSQNLQTSLDTERGKIETIHYNIDRSSSDPIQWTAVGLGAALAGFGFLIYYLFPLALLNFNISLLFYIFFGILLGMLFGLILLAINFERLMEIAVTYIFLFWENRTVFQLIGKNLTAHRRRNRKTTLMYAMALGFIIFVTVAFQIQLSSIQFQIRRDLGGELVIDGWMSFDRFTRIDNYLTSELKGNLKLLDDYTWTTLRMDNQRDIANTSISTLGRLLSYTTRVVGVPPNFWDIVDDKFLIIKEKHGNSPFSLGEQLYTVDGSGALVMGSLYRGSMALDKLDSRFVFESSSEDENRTIDMTRRVMIPQAFLDSSSVLFFSKFPSQVLQNSAISLPAFVKKSRVLQSMRRLTYDSIILRASEANVPALKTALVQKLTEWNYINLDVRDYYVEVKSLDVAKQVVNFFFIFTQVMAMFICFFSLSSSMATNIHEQTKEIGILRCVGFKTGPCTRLYVWEAFVLVVSASLLGVVIGVIVAYTMMLQQILFTELPLPFVFPYSQLIVVVAASLLFGFLSSFGPIRALLSAPSITQILRRMI